MGVIFLQAADLSGIDTTTAAGALGGVLAMLAAVLLVFLLVCIALYIYTSFAFMAIARRLKQSSPGLAWIPLIGPLIVIYRASKMHWWPWLLIIGMIIPLINFIAAIVFGVFCIIWMWKTFAAVGRPGWWSLVPVIGQVLAFIPVIGQIISLIAMIASLILIGIAAWGK